MEKSDDDGTTSWRCSYTNEEENTEDSSIITIATWLDELNDLRREIKSRKNASIILSCATSEELQEADIQFKQKINAAQGTASWTDGQGVGERAVDTLTEEPPD